MSMLIYTIVILCILIFVHELGHFGAAKLLKVRVNEFAIGMGPAFFKRQYGETKYSLRIFPIGGFCALEGEDETSGDERSFGSKPVWIRAVILAAGSFMNVALAVIVLSAIIFYAGTSVTTIIGEVRPDSPAQAAGLAAGDKIMMIDGVETEQWGDVVRQISGTEQNKLSIEVIRGGNELLIDTNVTIAEDGRRIIGITPKVARNPLTALVLGAQASYDMLRNMLIILGQLFTGNVPASDLTGPVGIAYIVDDTAKSGMRPLLYLVALISLNLAIVNLLPFPALDGGRLLFLFIRKITGKAITDAVEARFHLVGLVMLLALMVFVTWNDIDKLIRGVLW
jgi:regulator of sigma E protease